MIKIGKHCKWHDIKNGEVFALLGCWEIGYKIDDSHLICLATTGDEFVDDIGQILSFVSAKHSMQIFSVKTALTIAGENGQLYKLPKKDQNLWKEK